MKKLKAREKLLILNVLKTTKGKSFSRNKQENIVSSIPLSELISMISDPSNDVRQIVCEILGQKPAINDQEGEEQIVSALLQATTDHAWNVAQSAKQALINRQNHIATQYILKTFFYSQELNARIIACAALAGRTGDDVFIALEKATYDKNASIRNCAINVLADNKTTGITNILINALGDTDEKVQRAAVKALGQQTDATQALIKALNNPAQQLNACQALSNHKRKEATAALINCLQAKNEKTRIAACDALANKNGQNVIEALMDTARKDTIFVRYHALQALSNKKGKKIINEMIIAFNDAISMRRLAANFFNQLSLLGATFTNSIIQALIKATDDNDSLVRELTFHAIGNCDKKDRRIVNALFKAANDKNAKIRAFAYKTMANIEGEDVTKAIAAGINDIDWEAKICAENALQKRNGPEMPEIILQLVSHDNFNVRIFAYHFLIKNNPHCIKLLQRILVAK